MKRNEFGVIVCACGDELGDHEFGRDYCVLCDCKQYRPKVGRRYV